MKKQNLETRAKLCPYAKKRCAIDAGKSLGCIGEANYFQCVVYREFSKTDPKYLKK